jgi:hypothetical protein
MAIIREHERNADPATRARLPGAAQDRRPGEALDCFGRAVEESWQLVTTSYVLHESWALIQARPWRDRIAA